MRENRFLFGLVLAISIMVIFSILFTSCHPKTKAEYTATVKVEVLGAATSGSCSSCNEVYLSYFIGKSEFIDKINGFDKAVLYYFRKHKEEGLKLNIHITGSTGGGWGCGTVVVYYLGEQKIAESNDLIEYDKFIKLAENLPGFRYTILNDKPIEVNTLTTEEEMSDNQRLWGKRDEKMASALVNNSFVGFL